MSQTNKVYCKNCKYFVPMGGEWSGDYCHKVLRIVDSPWGHLNVVVDEYMKQNKNNNCKYYVKSWWRFWIKTIKKG